MDHKHSNKHWRKKSKEGGKKSSHKSGSASSKRYSGVHYYGKYPNGYLEDCSVPCDASSVPASKSKQHPFRYTPSSVILATASNLILNADNDYDIHFSTGISEGNGIAINEGGNAITFLEEGSYRFEICGEAAPFSSVEVKLIFYSDKFTDDLLPFSETNLSMDEGKLQLRGIATILPLQQDQTVIVRLVPDPDESIALLAHTRLMIYRVA